MKITIITVGKKFDSVYAELIERYQKRLHSLDIDWRFIAPEHRDTPQLQKQTESKKILNAIPEQAFVILLDETGHLINNNQLATQIAQCRDGALQLVIIIGGAYGVDGQVQERADVAWSLSPLVLPHQLVRLVLIEQLYRSVMILDGHPYHHQ